MRKLITSIRAFVVLTVIFGVIYPLLIFAVGQLVFPFQANGSLLEDNGKIVGSALIGQEFTLPKYFHSRFSFVKYNAADSGASNLAPSSEKLIAQTKQHLEQVRQENLFDTKMLLPADMVLSSGSGLDPYISLENAMLQMPRVAKTRNIPESKVKKLIYENVVPDFIGLWGKAGVNVLKLNLALDE